MHCLSKTNLGTQMKRKHNMIENLIRNYSSLILQVCNFPGPWSLIDFCTPLQVPLNVSKRKFHRMAIPCVEMAVLHNQVETLLKGFFQWLLHHVALLTFLCHQKLISHRPTGNWDGDSLLLCGQYHQRDDTWTIKADNSEYLIRHDELDVCFSLFLFLHLRAMYVLIATIAGEYVNVHKT